MEQEVVIPDIVDSEVVAVAAVGKMKGAVVVKRHLEKLFIATPRPF